MLKMMIQRSCARLLGGLLVFCLAAGPLPAADGVWMTEADIRRELVDQKLAGIYPSTVAWSEHIRADGTSDYEEAGIRSPGRWTVEGPLFCFMYDAPLAGGCFRMIKLGANCYELYVEREAYAFPSERPREGIAWNGRMWRTAEKATCDEKPSV